MKSILKVTAISIILSLTLTSLSAEDFSKLDVKKECDVKANGVEKLLETAEKYNKLAIENKVEFFFINKHFLFKTNHGYNYPSLFGLLNNGRLDDNKPPKWKFPQEIQNKTSCTVMLS